MDTQTFNQETSQNTNTEKVHPRKMQFLQEIKARGYESQYNAIVKEGYDRPGKILKLLIKFNGDTVQTLEKLQQKEEKNLKRGEEFKKIHKQKREEYLQKLKDEGLMSKYEALANQDYARPVMVYNLLKQFDNDEMKVLEEMKKRNVEKRSATKSGDEKGHHNGHMKQVYFKKLEDEGLMSKYEFLEKEGFSKPVQIYRLLAKWNNDEKKVLEILKDKQSKRGESRGRRCESRGRRCNGNLDVRVQFFKLEDQMTQLNSMGFDNKKRNFKILRRTSGDVDKAVAILIEKAEKDKNLSPFRKEMKTMKQELRNKLERLEGEGFLRKGKNMKILALCNGDCEQAMKVLRRKEERKQAKKVESKSETNQ